jgi:hypothetical protein
MLGLFTPILLYALVRGQLDPPVKVAQLAVCALLYAAGLSAVSPHQEFR